MQMKVAKCNTHGLPLVCYKSLQAGLYSAAGSASDFRSRGRKLESQLGHIAFVEINQEITP